MNKFKMGKYFTLNYYSRLSDNGWIFIVETYLDALGAQHLNSGNSTQLEVEKIILCLGRPNYGNRQITANQHTALYNSIDELATNSKSSIMRFLFEDMK
jgi:HD-like signal output (HDOD) protein